MEQRMLNMIISPKNGKNQGGTCYKLSVPPVWAKAIGVTDTDKKLKVTLTDDKKIIIEKEPE